MDQNRKYAIQLRIKKDGYVLPELKNVSTKGNGWKTRLMVIDLDRVLISMPLCDNGKFKYNTSKQ